MRPTTNAFMLCESKGKPQYTKQMQGTVVELTKQFLTWMLDVEMGHRLVITIGRNEENLRVKNNEQFAEDELATMLHELGLDKLDENDPLSQLDEKD